MILTRSTPIPSDTVQQLRERFPAPFDAAVVLGSGLGEFTSTLETRGVISTSDLAGIPPSTVAGHAGELVDALCGDTRVLVFRGRLHGYEGHAPERAALPALLSAGLGIPRLFLTNAAGGLHPELYAGDLMLITDLLITAMALGMGDARALPGVAGRLPRPLFREETLQRLRDAALSAGVTLREGCYGFCSGPTYETRAEIAFLRHAGADAAGMSTAPEIIAASELGIDVVAVSCITNKAVTVRTAVSHEEVTRVAAQVAGRFSALLTTALRRLNE